ncbi:YbdD/YjiX family protein [Aerophototrophica crusticola]|uniref:YbdD/YjiX family protein n=1 Tax=Aerophototrophica crusticola TaxID=1709002 RepID=A0A858R5D5_9PROT|nr:YbdD/YjiX family protein [Rhodospirillaceae bacterium B3]
MMAGPAGFLRTAWTVLREVSGDSAYETYLARHAVTHPEEPPLDREAFYLSELDRRWSGVNRCC